MSYTINYQAVQGNNTCKTNELLTAKMLMYF